MADFVNTIDLLGDDAVTDSIIDRSIAEFLDNDVKTIGAYAFYGCSNLTKIDLPAVTSIGESAFQGCSNLISVDLAKATILSSYAFQGCKALVSIKVSVPTTTTGYTFGNCTALTRLDFYSVSFYSQYDIAGCINIDTVIIRDTSNVNPLPSAVFVSTKIASGTGYIYVPSTLVDRYKSATNWSTYANQFRAIEDWSVDGTATGELDIANRCMVRFFNDDGSLLGYKVVAKGSDAVYDGTPVCSEDASWEFKGFTPSPMNVTTDIDCYAQYQIPFSLENASWAEISGISSTGEGTNYFSVGDTKSVALNGTMGTVSLNDTYDVYILGFDHNSEVEGSGIQFAGFKSRTGANDKRICIIDSKYSPDNGWAEYSDGSQLFTMNHWGGSNGSGWRACDMRYDILGSTDIPPSGYGTAKSNNAVGYDASESCATNPVENTLMSCLPSDLRAVMKPITKWTYNGGNGDSATVDYLPLLAECEVYGAITHGNRNDSNHQMQYAYFAAGSTWDMRAMYKHTAPDSLAAWFTRTRTGDTYGYTVTSAAGTVGSASHLASLGIAPVFMV